MRKFCIVLVLILKISGLGLEEIIFDSIYTVDNGQPGIESVYTFFVPGCLSQDSLSVYFNTLDSCDQFRLERWDGTTWLQVVNTGCVGVWQPGLVGVLNPQGPLVFTGQVYPNVIDPTSGKVIVWGNTHPFTLEDGNAFQTALPVVSLNWGSGIIKFPAILGYYKLTITNHPTSMTDWSFLVEKPIVGGIPPRLLLEDEVVCEGEGVVLKPLWVEAESPTTFEWWHNNQLISVDDSVIIEACHTLPGPFGEYEVEGLYTLLVTDSVGCTRSKDMDVNIEFCCEVFLANQENKVIYIPNVFSPNGDGVNDCFRGYLNPHLEAEVISYKFLIFDRWGNQVFEGKESDACWDGYSRGLLMDPAVFAWFIEIEFRGGCQFFQKGGVQLLR